MHQESMLRVLSMNEGRVEVGEVEKMDFFVLWVQYIYHMQIEGLGRRNSKGLERIQVNQLSKRTCRGATTHQFLAKLYLTREILEDCLGTFDIFKQMLEDPIQKNKIIRDITKTVQLKIYEQESVIYGKGQSSTSIYMVIKGSVSLCVPVPKEYKEGQVPKQTDTIDVEYQQINTFSRGQGFGQADFIHGKKRSLLAQAKISNTVIGQINGHAFEEVIELYKQRVYFKKIDMFGKCPLLQGLLEHQLEFIVNNAKPFSFNYAKEVGKQGEIPSSFFLIAEGEIELRKEFQKSPQRHNRHSLKNKITVEQAVKEKIKLKSMVVGILQQGQFLGDAELALSTPFAYSAVCKSQKVRVYICDQRILLSQIPKQKYQQASKYYKQKINYRQQKTNTYNNARQIIQHDIQANQVQVLNKDQMKIKRMISNRYVEKVPSLIGQMSPRDIGKIVDKKYQRLKSQPLFQEKEITYFPSITNKNKSDVLKANQRGYSPLLRRRKNYSPSPPKQTKQFISLSHNSLHSHINSNPSQEQQPYGSLLVHMRPFHSKVKSLHQRLSQMGEQTISRKYQLSKLPVNIVIGSQLQQKRMCEFISKIKEGKKRR